MKKIFGRTVLIVTAITALSLGSVFGSGLTFNGKAIDSDVDPMIINGRTLVPVKVIVDLLGGTTTWDQGTKTVTITKEGKQLEMVLGKKEVIVNGQDQTLDVPAISYRGRTMLPLSFVGNNLGAQISWDQQTRTAAITYESGQKLDPSKLTNLGEKKGQYPQITKTLEDSKYPEAKAFELKDQGGNTVKLEDYKGKFVVLNVFASWCPPCIEELPYFNEMYEHFGQNNGDVIILGLCSPKALERNRDKQGMIKFIQGKSLKYTVVMDESSNGEIIRNYMDNSIPVTHVISPNGKLVYRRNGSIDKAKDLIDPVERLLKGEAVQ